MNNGLSDEIEKQLHKEVAREVERNMKTTFAPEIIPFHALPIYKESTDFELNDVEKTEILLGGEFRKALSDKGNALSKSAEILESEKLLRVKNFILSKFDNFVTNHLQIKNQFCLTQSWSAVNHKGDAHHLHLHPNTVFSCVYYAQANSGDFQIKMPMSRIQDGYNFSYKILQNNIFNSRTYNASVKTGDILIFPGWLEHQALPNEDDAPRIIIGTNYFVKGILGDYDNKDQIEI